MSKFAKRLMVSVVVVLVVAAGSFWVAGAGMAQAQNNVDRKVDTSGIQAADPAPEPSPLSMEELRAVADYVSPDGRYVKIGDVEISAAPVVSR